MDFSGGPVIKNPPANAADTSSIPGLGRFHMQQSNEAPQLLSLCLVLNTKYLILKPSTLEPRSFTKRSHHNEKPVYSN